MCVAKNIKRECDCIIASRRDIAIDKGQECAGLFSLLHSLTFNLSFLFFLLPYTTVCAGLFMSYQDPYNNNAYYAGGSNYHQSQYPTYPSSNTYPGPQQGYDDHTVNDFNPYAPNVEYRQEQPHTQQQQSYQYDQNQYRDDNNDQTQYNYPPSQPSKRTPSRHTKKPSVGSVNVAPVRKEASGFEQGEFTPTVATRRPPRSAILPSLIVQSHL